MIFIDRSNVERPAALDPEQNPRIVKEREEARKFFKGAEHQRGQRRFRFKGHMHKSIREALKVLFHNKCAYCESKIGLTSRGDIEHYRPKSGVLESPDHPGYWWLSLEWDNMLISCQNCNRTSYRKGGSSGKGNRFPLSNEKARAFTPKDKIEKEQPLILNPCKDKPEDHLVYYDDGTVASETEKGKASIKVLGLNRVELVLRRKEVIFDIQSSMLTLDAKMKSNAKPLRKDLDNVLSRLKISDDMEFVGLRRQFVNETLDLLGLNNEQSDDRSVAPRYSKKKQAEVKKSYQQYDEKLSTASMAPEQRSDYLMEDHYIDKVELTNIKTFSKQEFDFTTSEGGTAPWMMLLGENGAGKSTVLKSISLNLCDADYFQKLINKKLVDPNKFIRHGTKVGTIKVWLNGLDKPRVLVLRKDKYTYTSPTGEVTEISMPLTKKSYRKSSWQAQTFLLGYGATRLLPRGSKGEAAIIHNKYGRVDNLFNPFVPLSNAEKWLSGLDAKLFRRAAIILKDLLNMGEEEELVRKEGEIMVKVNGAQVPFGELSDGYQSVVALITDVLELVMSDWPNPDEARGIVMLDEVGAHLHPRWKMRIVDSLRKALPHMQFIVSTHQPLCLRGVGKGEVVIMRRDEDKNVEVLTDLPNPKDMKISQILTSAFGLSSTMDPETEVKYNRYNVLRAMHKRTEEESVEMEELRIELEPHLLVGETLLDAQAYKVVEAEYNQFKKKDKKISDVKELSKSTLSAVQALWSKKV